VFRNYPVKSDGFAAATQILLQGSVLVYTYLVPPVKGGGVVNWLDDD
jgi:hypothetical protein